MTADNADVIDLDDGNEVRGFNIDPSGTGGGIAGTTGDVSGTIDDVNIIDTGTSEPSPVSSSTRTTGTFNVSNLTVSTNGATGVRLNNAGTVIFAAAGNISITSSEPPAWSRPVRATASTGHEHVRRHHRLPAPAPVA